MPTHAPPLMVPVLSNIVLPISEPVYKSLQNEWILILNISKKDFPLLFCEERLLAGSKTRNCYFHFCLLCTWKASKHLIVDVFVACFWSRIPYHIIMELKLPYIGLSNVRFKISPLSNLYCTIILL